MGKVKAWLMELEERRHEENLEDYEAKMLEQIDEDREAYDQANARMWWEHEGNLVRVVNNLLERTSDD
jgi:hypothetical protein|tara:strand:+ start:148 stop:351 length:204 start_codon:yes stop_codon:yes gene_type:complete